MNTKQEDTAKPTSLKKIEANRRNALRSTGPKSAAGKCITRWNALKHGLLAQEVIIPRGAGREDDMEFYSLLESLRHDIRPDGTLQEMLVEKIAVCYWRLRRVLQAENGEIQQELDHVISDASKVTPQEIGNEIMSENEFGNWIAAEKFRRQLPNASAADKIIRYEGIIERQLSRALTHLERMRRYSYGEGKARKNLSTTKRSQKVA